MKNLLIIIICTLVITDSYATIIRVNNTGADADYTDLQTAVTNANSGDTLHVEPSPVTYGSINLTKQLTLIGHGYFLGENVGYQSSATNSSVTYIYLYPGCDGSVITGLDISYINRLGVGDITDVLITRNNINQISLASSYTMSDIFITQNYFRSNSGNYGFITSGSGSISLVVTNNIFNYSTIHNRVATGANTTGIFTKNVFDGYSVTTYNSSFQDNIFGYSVIVDSGASNLYNNNICSGTQLPATNGNLPNEDMNSVFEDYANTDANFTSDTRYQLATGSVAIGAGITGEDCGAYGGVDPYRVSGIPAVPSIYKLIAPTTVTGNFTITLSTRSNN